MKRRAIYVATSHDCAANLAGEAYLIKQDLEHILYLWVNNPCIVVGRFQNPYSEFNLERMDAEGVQLVRRNSGWGAVYHDKGNLCFTLIGEKTLNREENLRWSLQVSRNSESKPSFPGAMTSSPKGKKYQATHFSPPRQNFVTMGHCSSPAISRSWPTTLPRVRPSSHPKLSNPSHRGWVTSVR